MGRTVLLLGAVPAPPARGASPIFNYLGNSPAVRYVVLASHRGQADGLASGGRRLDCTHCFWDSPDDERGVWRRAVARVPAIGPLFQTARLVRAGARAMRDARADLVMAISDLGPALIAAWIVGRLTGRPYAYFMADLFRGNLLSWPKRAAARLLERPLFEQSAAIITNNETTAEYYRERYGSRFPVHVAELPATGAPGVWTRPSPPYQLVFTGNVYWAQAQALENFVLAMDRLDDLPVEMRIYCPSPSRALRRLVGNRPRVWLGSAPFAEMPQVQRRATLLLLPLAWNTRGPDIVATATPSKYVEYLVSGRPILVHAPAGSHIARDVATHRTGLVVDRNDVDALASTIREFLRDPAPGRELVENALALAARRHDPGAAVERLATLLDAAAAAETPPRPLL